MNMNREIVWCGLVGLSFCEHFWQKLRGIDKTNGNAGDWLIRDIAF